MSEFQTKQDRIQTLLSSHNLDGLLLQRVSSFAWATCGAASYVNVATTTGEATLLITRDSRFLFTNNIESPRFEGEEQLLGQGWEFEVFPWHQMNKNIYQRTRGLKLGADVTFPGALDFSAEIADLRSALTPEEGERFRILGKICAQAMDSAIQNTAPGQTEHEIAARLAYETESRGAQVVVNLIATDERIFNYRHPLPTNKTLDRYAMLVLCGRWRGLICSLTRLVHFGPLPDELRYKAEAVALVDATMISATRPGQIHFRIFEQAVAAYADTGFPDEWQLHHQGGTAGYEGREHIITPISTGQVAIDQAYAWNPSITGTKSEDTILVGPKSNEILTTIDDWPTIDVTVDGRQISRPAILERRLLR